MSIIRDPNMERIKTKEIAEKFINEQIINLQNQIGDKKVLLAKIIIVSDYGQTQKDNKPWLTWTQVKFLPIAFINKAATTHESTPPERAFKFKQKKKS